MLAGKWTASINTQIGKQEYVYTIESKHDKMLGSAAMKLEGNDFRSELELVAQHFPFYASDKRDGDPQR